MTNDQYQIPVAAKPGNLSFSIYHFPFLIERPRARVVGAIIEMSEVWDAVIIGGGHNGLVCAAYLARGGLRVLVLERRGVLGGASVTEEIFPGFKFSTAAYLCSLLQERIIRELDLPRHGYYVYPKDPAYFSPFPDDRYLMMWQSEKETRSEIAKV